MASGCRKMVIFLICIVVLFSGVTADIFAGQNKKRIYYSDLSSSKAGEFTVYTGGRKLFSISLVVELEDFKRVFQKQARMKEIRRSSSQQTYKGMMNLSGYLPGGLKFTQDVTEVSSKTISIAYSLEFTHPIRIENMALLFEMDPESWENGSIATGERISKSSRFPDKPAAGAFFSSYARHINFKSNQGEKIYLDMSNSLRVMAFDMRSNNQGFPVRILLPVKMLLSKVRPNIPQEFSFTLKFPGIFSFKPVNIIREKEAGDMARYEIKIDKPPVDFSDFLESPAGKNGKIKAEKGVLVFNEHKPERFYGIELADAQCLPKSGNGAQMASYIASLGINLVWITGGWDELRDAGDNKTRLLDRLLDFAYELRSRGVYLSFALPEYSQGTAESLTTLKAILETKCAADDKALKDTGAVVFVSCAAPGRSSGISGSLKKNVLSRIKVIGELKAKVKAIDEDILFAGPGKLRTTEDLRLARGYDAVMQSVEWPKASGSRLKSDPNRMSPATWCAFGSVRGKPLIFAYNPTADGYCAEQPVWATTVASLQGADIIILRNFFKSKAAAHWNNPAIVAQLPVLATSFIKMDIPPSRKPVAVYYSDDSLLAVELGNPVAIAGAESAAFEAVIGGSEPLGKFLRPEDRVLREINPVEGAGGRLLRYPEDGVLQIKSAYWEGLIGNLTSKPRWKGRNVVFQGTGYAALMVASLSDDEIGRSSDLIAIAVGITGSVSGAKRGVIPVSGSLRIKSRKRLGVWAVTNKGKEFTVDHTYNNGYVIFKLVEKKPVLHYILSSPQ